LTLKKEVVDFQALLTERLSLNREAFEAKQLTLSQDSSSAQVYGDPQRLTQIIDNLLSNALYYTAAGGCITVELSQRDDKATLTVTDTGVGIAAEDLPHIFDRFWRSDQSRSRHTGGAGIGLAIVHALVIAHNGQVSVQSQPGKGSSFIVTLPTRS
jgi:signal transduction histidine kinase